MSLKKYAVPTHPLCSAGAVLQGENYRISMLTTALIRFEYSEDGKFEDHATQMVYNREFPVPEFRVVEKEETLDIYTKNLEIHYDKQKFTPGGLMVRVAGGMAGERVWHYGEETKDLRGTARTLDWANGEIPLEHGIMSKDGFSVLNDSHTMVLMENGSVKPRQNKGEDFYFFGYGHRFLECLKDFYHLCGKTPLLPRYVLGNWWSRYHKYDEAEYKELVERFEKEKVPFSVAVIDMDWHLVEDVDPVYGSGWTGYTWNKKLFPDPPEFLKWLHDHNMKVTLNVHPADGIRPYEEAYPRIAKKMGMDPEQKEPVLFDIADDKFLEVYLNDLHHPMEEDGVDFWWLDWQQGTVTKIPGLDPLWMLNHYHYLDSVWKGKRQLTFSRYAGPGSHRYPIGFSGDTIITWESLKFQPYFTANASNIGYGWWSHDIGGHMFGYRDDELTARWVELGVFSPINRLHSTDNPFNGKEPWKYNRIVEETMKKYLRMRHSLVPYLYTMNKYASRDGIPLVQPMYYQEPDQEQTYHVPNNYYFGNEMMVSPITEKMDEVAVAAKAVTWIPKGVWYDFFNGRRYDGGRLMELWRTIDEIPVLVKEGGIIPLKDMEEYDNSIDNPEKFLIKIFPGNTGSFELWEDQGDTAEDNDENWVKTRFAKEKNIFIISRAAGNTDVIPVNRTWKLWFYGVKESNFKIYVGDRECDCVSEWKKNPDRFEIIVKDIPVDQEICVEFVDGITECEHRWTEEIFAVLERAQIEYNLKSEILSTIQKLGKDAVASLNAMHLNQALYGELLEILTAEM